MSKDKKDQFYIEIEESISLGLLAAYGKIYSGKYLKKEEICNVDHVNIFGFTK